MATNIRIGHASTDDASSAAQVLISSYYAALKPTVVLRPNSTALAEKSAAACEAGCNNNKIGYSQSSRDTLYTEAKKVNYNLSNIAENCHADCSSFMTVCAIAGGAHINYGSGAPNCGSMKARFVDSGDYTALTSDVYLNSSDYLRRGDILVRETYLNGSRHTVMVLDNGSKILTDPQDDYVITDFFAIKIVLNMSAITATEATATAKITKIENGKEKSLSSTEVSQYNWKYSVVALDDKDSEASVEKLQIAESSAKFSLTDLTPNIVYSLKVQAVKLGTGDMYSSPDTIFATVPEYPTAIRNLKVSFKDITTSLLDKQCTISFDEPNSWGSSFSQKGYNLVLIVNGNIVATNNTTIRTSKAHINKVILLSDITKNLAFSYGDVVQIGILPWIKNRYDDMILANNTFLKCSKPLYINNTLTPVNHIYMKIKDTFKRVLLYNNIRED